MPFSTGVPYHGKYRYFIDPRDPSSAILQEFAGPPPLEYKTISTMRFRSTKIKSVMFDGNFTITSTCDNKIYMGIIAENANKIYNSILKLDMFAHRILMVSGCHIIVSQCTNRFFDGTPITIYYNKDCNVCVKKSSDIRRIWSVWPDLNTDTEMTDNSIVTLV